MRSMQRLLLPLVVGAAALVAGLFISRALFGGDASEPDIATASVLTNEDAAGLLNDEFVGTSAIAPDQTLTVADLLAPPDAVIQLLAPVASLDERPGDQPLDAIATDAQLANAAGQPTAGDDAVSSFATDFPVGGAVGGTRSETPVEADPDPVEIAILRDVPLVPPASDDPANDEVAAPTGPIEVRELGVPISALEPDSDDGEPPSAGDVPSIVMPDFGISITLDPVTFDPCAGPEPGAVVTCETEGWAGTLFALSTPPELQILATAGHADSPLAPGGLICPASTEAPTASRRAVTIWSTAPLVSATLTAQPVGAAVDPVEVVASTPGDVVAAWNARFDAADEYDRSWGLVPTCVIVDVGNTDITYQVTGVAVDTFDRLGAVPPVTLRTDDAERPPTETRIEGVSPTAFVRAWTTAEGSIVFRQRPLAAGTVSDDELDCETAPVASPVFPSNRPNPDIYDPDFSRSFFTKIPFMTGGRLLVCVEIYDTDNTVRPLVVERHLFEAPMQPRPEMRLLSLDTRNGGDAIDPLVVRTGAFSSGLQSSLCGQTRSVPAIEDDTLAVVDELIWGCWGPQTTLTPTGSIDVGLQVLRDGVPIVEAAIPIDANDCRTERCPQRTDYFRIPIAAPGELVCFRGAVEVCPGDPDVDAVALIAVRYPLVVGTGGLQGRVTPLDDVDLSTFNIVPRITDPTMTVVRNGFRWDATFRFQSDRPIRAAVEAFELPDGNPCYVSERTETTADLSEEFAIRVPNLCASRNYAIFVHATDEEGRSFRLEPTGGFVVPAAPTGQFDVQLGFVAGPGAPDAVHIEQFGARLRGARTGSSRLAQELPHSGPASVPECYEVASPSRPYADIRTTVVADADGIRLEAVLPVRFADAAGADDCGRAARDWQLHTTCSGLARSSDEWRTRCQGTAYDRGTAQAVTVWRFSIELGYDELEAAGTAQPIVVATEPNDDGVALRFTLQRQSQWRFSPSG
jgi:hypothetical protein